MQKQLPPFEALKDISDRLKNAGLKHALGGSGMLAYLDLIDQVHDWDITTDAPLDKVTPLLADIEYEHVEPSGIYASEYLLKIKLKGASMDLIGNFAIKSGNAVFKLPILVTAEWEGIPVGSPAAWAKAYELMNRPEKAKLLLDYLAKNLSK